MTDDFTVRWHAWHDRREQRLRAPYGWLSLTGLHWLGPDPLTVDGLPGVWRTDAGAVVVEAAADAALAYGGTLLDGSLRIATTDGEAEHPVMLGERRIEVIERGGWLGLRVRDPHSATRASFTGIPAYAPSGDWVLEGRFSAYAQPKPVLVPSVVDGLSQPDNETGVIHFEYAGNAYSLVALDGGDGALDVLFRDATSGDTTYGAGRTLTVAAPDAGGRVTLDFNRAYNLPCAFTEYATCPVAPPENRLPFPVTAGEQSTH
ncbi:DUF1684 domain-containing protein [Hamadaea tsunoensis]|uniref:DUF1684 domain-containing protein n=1 Tax=Hamadaea tsunoensis TaxID=53368 RepID=UPI00041D6B36|nr:DUF1684 domain-containing protein [Hamadaea tsunoensis]